MRKIIIALMVGGVIVIMAWYCNNGDANGYDVCPNCKSDSITEKIVYGLLTPEEKANPDHFYNVLREQGIVYGGCVVGSNGPRYYCYNCGYKW